jgi:N-methylhydantoinase A
VHNAEYGIRKANTVYRVAIDTGGTFTDVVAIDDETGTRFTTKTPSTPSDPAAGFMDGVRKIAAVGGFDPREIGAVVHGTTTATNAVLEGRFDRLGLIVTRGFRHVLEIARQSVPDGYGNSYFWVKPPRIVSLERVAEVGGRMDHHGAEIDPLDDADVEAAAKLFERRGVDCISVCLLHSYANAEHERRIGERLRELLPDAFVSLSSEVLPEYREYERAMTTIVDVMVKPYTRDYLMRAERDLTEQAGGVPFLIMQSNGGVVSARLAAEKPVTTLLSGPAAGVLAASFIGERAGYRNLLILDAGGTSTDVSLVEDLQPQYTTEGMIDRFPVKTPMVDVVPVGAGGGSIAWIGPHGTLKVGPQSAGADPGPICYGRGGTEPTVTDANLVLGRIPERLLGGELALAADAARAGIERIAEPLGLSLEEAAAGIIEVAVWNQTHGIRRVSVERGRDPSDYCLVAFGGSGGMVATEVADLLGIATVLVPQDPGTASAFGLQVSDIKRDYVVTLVRNASQVEPGELERAWVELERRGADELAAEGVAEDDILLTRSVDARYEGEAHEVPVPVAAGELDAPALDGLREGFHGVHEQTFGYAYRDQHDVEIVNLRVQAVGRVHRPRLPEESVDTTQTDPAPSETRPVWFDSGFRDCAIYEREALPPGTSFDGPAVVQEFGSTVVVRPEWHVEVDAHRNLVLKRR